ncbi:MAG TPA: glycoside hydrolase [Candidatus Methylomirabilis sp.]|nr:glycoside hydrolase [Candidatus Methylomirabilis sp.]
MVRITRRSAGLWISVAVAFCFATGAVAQVSPDLFSGLQWRNIGPYHGGRIASVSGVIGEPGTFYVGLPQAGIWKTTSGGMTWYPIFDQVTEVDSIGAIQVAPSDANIIYAGSGDAVSSATTGTNGNGMYKSTDAGKTWTHIGLEGTTRIPKIVVDPKDPNIVIVVAMGGATGTQRGIFRTDNGGQSWINVLHPDDKTGGRDLSSPFDEPNIIFATTEEDPVVPPVRGGAPPASTGPSRTKLYKSLDEGKTWTEITTNPSTTGRIAVAVAMHTNGQRIYVIGAPQQNGSGLFRSDDQGATWKHMAGEDTRIVGRDYICGVWVDTQNPDVLYTLSTAAYKSTDGGETFFPFKGAPGGEDMHDIWIDPTDSKRMLFGVDQGAAVTFDGGLAWSSYYALPVAQVYHISTDNRYPYWVLGSQQDTGAVMTRTRGDVGTVSEVDWMPVPSSEFGTLTADPLDPNIIYGVGYGAAGGGSGLVKINLKTGQWENVARNFGTDAAKYRSSRDAWRRADPFDPHAIYTNMQCLLVSRDAAHSWKAFSPDLTTEKGKPQVPCGTPAPAPAAATPAGAPAAGPVGGRGGPPPIVISDFAISTVRKGVFWTVSSNRQIYNTMDNGAHWNNVSNVADSADVTFNTIEAGHTDANTAYLSGRVGGGGRDGSSPGRNVPLIWRTHDSGKTWSKIVDGLPSDQPTGSWVNVIREDPKQKGLLFAGTETTVYVSFDDGDHWQSLRQNLPSTSIRDMVFHTDDHMSDLVIGTYGRGFYVLDDTTPLREIAAKSQAIAAAPVYFFKPGDAIRSRVSDNWDQPLNPELPHSPNPPYGAILYYHLSQPPSGEIKLQVFDAKGKLVRTMSSIPPVLPERWPYPEYWVAKGSDLALPTKVGTNRTNWDLRYDDPPAFNLDLENQMNVAPGGFVTPGPHGPQVIPGVYTLKLIVDGQTYIQTVKVHNDPRVGETAKVMADLRTKNELMLLAYQGAKDSYAGNSEVLAVRQQVASISANQLPTDVAKAKTDLDAKLATFGGIVADRSGRGGGAGGGVGRGRGGEPAPGALKPFNALNGSFNAVVSTSQVGLDEAPTQAQIDTWEADCKDYNATVAAWKKIQSQDLVAFNTLLSKNNLNPLHVSATALTDPSCTFATPAAPRASVKK